MKNKLIQYRQGDLLFETIDCLPDNAVKQPPAKLIVLAEGEATGHAHTIAGAAADWWKSTTSTDQFLRIKRRSPVRHQEHSRIDLDVGLVRVRRQREFAPQAPKLVSD